MIFGPMAEWLGKGLQNPVRQFKSASDLKVILPGWWNGRHKGLKILRPQGHASSSLAPGTWEYGR
jgi:hypothetical protein